MLITFKRHYSNATPHLTNAHNSDLLQRPNKADLPESHILKLIKALDKDKDGTLSIKELASFVDNGMFTTGPFA